MNLAELVEELVVQTWERDPKGRPTDRSGPPLMRWLRETAFGPLVGRGGAGKSGSPAPINVEAMKLWEQIAEEIAQLYISGVDDVPYKSPEVNLRDWAIAFQAAASRNDTVEQQHQVAYDRLERWTRMIRDHFDPPWGMEIVGACPICHEDRVRSGYGEEEVEHSALRARVHDGELEANCANPTCRSRWSGNVAVINLARQMGHPLDVDAIREAGMPAPKEEPA